MTALWNIAVLDKGPDWMTVEVRQAHPDAGPFPEARSFALRLLHERCLHRLRWLTAARAAAEPAPRKNHRR